MSSLHQGFRLGAQTPTGFATSAPAGVPGAARTRVVYPQHRFLFDDEAFDVAVQFRREHPQRLRLLSTILGWGDLRDDAAVRGFIRTHPFVAFRPATTSPT